MDANYIRYTIAKIQKLLVLGYSVIADDINSNESIIMRVACDLLQDLNRCIQQEEISLHSTRL